MSGKFRLSAVGGVAHVAEPSLYQASLGLGRGDGLGDKHSSNVYGLARRILSPLIFEHAVRTINLKTQRTEVLIIVHSSQYPFVVSDRQPIELVAS